MSQAEDLWKHDFPQTKLKGSEGLPSNQVKRVSSSDEEKEKIKVFVILLCTSSLTLLLLHKLSYKLLHIPRFLVWLVLAFHPCELPREANTCGQGVISGDMCQKSILMGL